MCACVCRVGEWECGEGDAHLRARAPQDGALYSVGVRHVLDTAGARAHLDALRRRVPPGGGGAAPEGPDIVTLLCPRVGGAGACPWENDCPHLHVDPAGRAARRRWPAPHAADAGPQRRPVRECAVCAPRRDRRPPSLLRRPAASTPSASTRRAAAATPAARGGGATSTPSAAAGR